MEGATKYSGIVARFGINGCCRRAGVSSLIQAMPLNATWSVKKLQKLRISAYLYSFMYITNGVVTGNNANGDYEGWHEVYSG